MRLVSPIPSHGMHLHLKEPVSGSFRQVLRLFNPIPDLLNVICDGRSDILQIVILVEVSEAEKYHLRRLLFEHFKAHLH